MVGQSYLPQIVDMLRGRLTYHWTIAYMTPGGQATQLWQRKVNTFWKPVLWFVKGAYSGPWIGDVALSRPNDNDKRFHHWGQSESSMADLIRRCSEPGQVILDPFCGGGTTGVVALDLDRRFIGCDIDDGSVARTLSRLNEALPHAA
jgi:site-specific DNA-methyltransferase (adenine-specific)